MKLSDLFDEFDGYTIGPIELTDIAEAIVQKGLPDRIVFSPQPINPGKLRATYYQYRQMNGAYSTELVSLIVYSNEMSIVEQRVACAKELAHICDPDVSKPKSKEDIRRLADDVLKPLSPSESDHHTAIATIDKVGEYRAYALLIPEGLREQACEAVLRDVPLERVADWLQVPEYVVNIVVSDAWPLIRKVVAVI